MAILLLFLEVAWKSAVTKRNLPVTGAAPTQPFFRLARGTDQKDFQVCSDVQQGANFLQYWHHFCVLKIIRQDTKSNIEGKVNTGRTTPKAGAYLRNDKNFIEPLWFSDQSLSIFGNLSHINLMTICSPNIFWNEKETSQVDH